VYVAAGAESGRSLLKSRSKHDFSPSGASVYQLGAFGTARADPLDDCEGIWRMFANQVRKIGGVDATLGAFADRRQIEAGDEVAAPVEPTPAPLRPGFDGEDGHGVYRAEEQEHGTHASSVRQTAGESRYCHAN
jgi:hypothetical protein